MCRACGDKMSGGFHCCWVDLRAGSSGPERTAGLPPTLGLGRAAICRAAPTSSSCNLGCDRGRGAPAPPGPPLRLSLGHEYRAGPGRPPSPCCLEAGPPPPAAPGPAPSRPSAHPGLSLDTRASHPHLQTWQPPTACSEPQKPPRASCVGQHGHETPLVPRRPPLSPGFAEGLRESWAGAPEGRGCLPREGSR